MDSFFILCLGAGLGVAVGSLAAATGRVPSLLSLLGAIAVLAGLVVAAAVASLGDDSIALAALGGLLGAAIAVAVLGGFVIAASRRATGAGGLAVWVGVFALIVAGLTLLLPPLALLAVAALVWLGLARRRREPRKYKGLRSLT